MDLRSKLGEATLLAGGTDIMPRYERGQPLPDHLIDLKKLPDLHQLNHDDDTLQIGALTTIQTLVDTPLIQAEFKALHLAARDFAGAQIRHRGTLGGNIVNASPAGDLLPGLYAFEARLTLVGPNGLRELPIQKFILGPGKTCLEPGELLVSIILPRHHHESGFQKIGLRQSMAISVANMAFVYSRQADAFRHLRIACGAVAPTVVRLDKLTSTILDGTSQPEDWPALIEADIAPIDDIRATARYRKQVVVNLVTAFLEGRL